MIWKKRNKHTETVIKEFPEILKQENMNHRNYEFYNAFMELTSDCITEDTSRIIEKIYQTTKLVEFRKQSLKLLCQKDFDHLVKFFADAYKRERYLDMKILAIRGLAQFISESEIDKLLTKFNTTLKKRPQSTPYNYQEYEFLKGQNALPYLVDRYNYPSFKETLEIVERQYNNMPDAFKGHFTVDSDGEIIQLRSSEKSRKIIDEFFKKQGIR
ncbi:hypothetical protein SAMN05216474_0351 [Lishizhenia tianjinensis]|uniref:Uncharacterized protein n=1 Tax=Lishizhenia tianjinensis TaxID=477690 RepID=A0A1I6XP43_9FLAO|nr:hypothetical protein [Lishizhenia tianjinensis]SFT40050.1 hypothetical protein SAMN05216474_0351 [Lishizhenia tianjinensis]